MEESTSVSITFYQDQIATPPKEYGDGSHSMPQASYGPPPGFGAGTHLPVDNQVLRSNHSGSWLAA